jgi:hypothetical protein
VTPVVLLFNEPISCDMEIVVRKYIGLQITSITGTPYKTNWE